jgi:hypothetical protein
MSVSPSTCNNSGTKMTVSWVVAPRSLIEIYRRFRGACCLQQQGEAASTSELSVNFYQTTRCKNPEDGHLHTRRRENLKSTRERLNGFPWNLISVLLKFTDTFQCWLKSDSNNWHSTWRHAFFYARGSCWVGNLQSAAYPRWESPVITSSPGQMATTRLAHAKDIDLDNSDVTDAIRKSQILINAVEMLCYTYIS